MQEFAPACDLLEQTPTRAITCMLISGVDGSGKGHGVEKV